MNVLHLLAYSPEPPMFGGALRVHYLLKNLAANHDVTVVCFGEPGAENAICNAFDLPRGEVFMVPPPWYNQFRRLTQACSHLTMKSFAQLSCTSKAMQSTLDLVLARKEYDAILIEFPMMGCYSFASQAVRILDAHNVENDVYRRMCKSESNWIRKSHYYIEYLKLRREELAVCAEMDAVWVTSDRDGEFFKDMAPDVPCFTVPNGVDMAYSVPDNTVPEPHTMVFTGMMGYVPNSDGILDFLDNVFPLVVKEIPDAQIYIVGSQPPDELIKRAAPNIVVTGFVEDVRPFVRRAKAYVVPLRMGGGTRLKILEAFGMRKPVVTTSIGREGITTGRDQALFVADDHETFARHIIDILNDTVDHAIVAENGFRLASNKYDWKIIGSTMEVILQSTIHPTEHQPESILNEPSYV